MVQLPLAGMVAPLNLSEVVVLVSDIPVPVQVVDAAVAAGISRLPGSVTLMLDWMSVNPFGFDKVISRVETAFSPTLAGEKDSVMVGANGLTWSAAGHAVALVPADAGAVLVAEPAGGKVTVSTLPAESVTVNVRVPPATGLTVTCGMAWPLTIMFAGAEVHLYEAMLSGTGVAALGSQAATLPLASMTLPGATLAGITMTPIGLCAACTACSASTIPVPH